MRSSALVTTLLLSISLTTVAVAAPVPEPLIPSSPHRVLRVQGDPVSYYLVEVDRPLIVDCEGPGLLELTLRRAVEPDEEQVKRAGVKVSIGDELRPPINFRRTRDGDRRFEEETRFHPSAPRFKKLPVPVGAQRIKIELGQAGIAVAVALQLRPATGRVGPLPELVAPVTDVPPVVSAAPPPDVIAAIQPTPPAEPPTAAGIEEGPATEPTPSQVEEVVATLDQDGSAPVSAAAAEQQAPQPHGDGGPVVSFDASFGLSSTFIGIGAPSPTLRLGARYVPPWLDGQLSVGAEAGVVGYNVHAPEEAALQLEANNWVFPLLIVAAFSPHLVEWLHLEAGLGAGVVLNYGALDVEGRSQGSFGVGGGGALYGEAGVLIGPGAVYARFQGDLISASNEIFRRFDYLGSSTLVGYRLRF